ncbi:hypothetical protein ACERZ8_12815 [Tateyamaria armeniaca]|uniref:Uncharacterized protein n=1 Tax=Tateyamaria armeniaca TaxID=2518930 RepID=A0ABW8UV03_9RHOB
MIRAALVSLLLLCPSALFAQSQLERLEAVSEQMNLEMAKMMAREISANGGDPAPVMAALPDTSWDDEYRAAGTCMLNQYNAAAGTQGTDSMLDKMEAMIPQLETATMESLENMDVRPEGVSEDQSIQIARSCGMIDLSMRRMQESGFTAAMMQAFSEAQGN